MNRRITGARRLVMSRSDHKENKMTTQLEAIPVDMNHTRIEDFELAEPLQSRRGQRLDYRSAADHRDDRLHRHCGTQPRGCRRLVHSIPR